MKTLVMIAMMIVTSQAMALDFNKEIEKHSSEVEVVQMAIQTANQKMHVQTEDDNMQLKLIAVSSAGERQLRGFNYLQAK